MLKLNRNLPETISVPGSLVCTGLKINWADMVKLAELVLPIYENECPNDDRPRKAIAAAKTYQSNPLIKNRQLLDLAKEFPNYANNDASYSANQAIWETVSTTPWKVRAGLPAYWASRALSVKKYNIYDHLHYQPRLNLYNALTYTKPDLYIKIL